MDFSAREMTEATGVRGKDSGSNQSSEAAIRIVQLVSSENSESDFPASVSSPGEWGSERLPWRYSSVEDLWESALRASASCRFGSLMRCHSLGTCCVPFKTRPCIYRQCGRVLGLREDGLARQMAARHIHRSRLATARGLAWQRFPVNCQAAWLKIGSLEVWWG